MVDAFSSIFLFYCDQQSIYARNQQSVRTHVGNDLNEKKLRAKRCTWSIWKHTHLKAYTSHCPKINYENAMFMQWCDARITILLICENPLVSDSCLGVSIENLSRFSHCMNAILIIFIHFYAMSSCLFFLVFELHSCIQIKIHRQTII